MRSLGTIPNRPESIRKLVKKLGPAESLRVCYEAGPTGYVLYWQLTALGRALRGGGADAGAGEGGRSGQDGSAGCGEAGAELPGRRPDAGVGAGRGARGAAGSGARAGSGEEGPAPRPASAGQVPAAPRPAAADRDEGVDAAAPGVGQDSVQFEQPAQEATLLDYLDEVEHVAERIERLERAIDEAVQTAPPRMRAVIEALQALRGIAKVSAVTIVAEVGELSRFARPRSSWATAGWSRARTRAARGRGGAASPRPATRTCDASSSRRPGPIGTGRPSAARCANARRAQRGGEGDRLEGAAPAARALPQLLGRGKCQQQVVTAVGRELLGFIWAIGVTVEREQRKTSQSIAA